MNPSKAWKAKFFCHLKVYTGSVIMLPYLYFSGIVRRKTLVLDLDETLIHSFHDGVLRPTVRPGTPPDFILKVTIDRHPVRFFVHKRPHVDFFLQIVSIFEITSL